MRVEQTPVEVYQVADCGDMAEAETASGAMWALVTLLYGDNRRGGSV